MTVAGDPFLAPRSNPDQILAAIRQQLFFHKGAGRQNIVAFQEAFNDRDGDGDHKLSRFKFEKALTRCGVFLPAQEINALFRRFDTGGDGHADSEKVLSALAMPLNKRRLAVVDEAFSSIGQAAAPAALPTAAAPVAAATSNAAAAEQGGGGDFEAVTLSEALARVNPSAHPEVLAGRLGAQQVKEDFSDFFGNLSGVPTAGEEANPKAESTTTADASTAVTPAGPAAAAAAPVTRKGFREYYRDVAVCEPYDNVFVPMMEALWGVQEPRPKKDSLSELARRLRPKLLEHSHHAETTAEVNLSPRPPPIAKTTNFDLQKVFKKVVRYYGLSHDEGLKHGGMVTPSGLEMALNRFGIFPEKHEVEDVFANVGAAPGAPEEVGKVVAVLCPPEPPMAPIL